MSDPFWYLSKCLDDPSTVAEDSTSSVSIATSTTTSSGEYVPTPSTTTDTYTVSDDGGHVADAGLQKQLVSSVVSHHAAGMPLIDFDAASMGS